MAAIKDIIEADLKLKKKVQTILYNVKAFADKIPKERLKGVEHVFPEVKGQLTQNNAELDRTNAVILIAGQLYIE